MRSILASSGQNPVPDTPTPVTYNLYGLPNTVNLGSGDSDSFQYDSATGRMTQYQATVTGSSMTGVLTWNPNGSLQQLAITDPFNANNAQTCTHVHDDLARIAKVDCGSNKWGQSFGFDVFGNVNWSQLSGHTGTTFQPGLYSNTNRFPSSVGTYDSNGNLTSDGAHPTYSWDADGKLHQIDSTTMTYL